MNNCWDFFLSCWFFAGFEDGVREETDYKLVQWVFKSKSNQN